MPYIGKQPASVPVTADDIPNDSITSAKILDNVITISDIGPNAVGSSEMADDAIGLNELSATGTTNSSTFLRGDNTWAVPYAIQDGQLSQNNFTNDDHTKLNNIETAATADQTAAQIKTHLENGIDSVHYVDRSVDAVHIAANTITANEVAANAIGTSEIIDDAVTAAKLANSINTDIATGVTGNTTANAALPKAGGAMTGAITTNSTFDGVDIATRDGVLTSTTNTANAAMPKAGGTFTGDIALATNAYITANGTNSNLTVGTSSAGSTGLLKLQATGDIKFHQYGSSGGWKDTLTIKGSGNVGIGTSSFGATYDKLAVAGGINIQDDNGGKLEIGRYSSTVPNSYIKLGANSSSLRFTNNADNADLVTIENGGNVGIGTSSPAKSLTVHTTSGTAPNGLYLRNEVHGANSKIYMYAENDAGTLKGAGIQLDPDTEVMSLGSNIDSVFIKADGNVGIGTDAPTRALYVRKGSGAIHAANNYDVAVFQGADAPGIRIVETGVPGVAGIGQDNGNMNVASGGFMRFSTGLGSNEEMYNGGDERMRIDSSGNVGIGTASPTEAFSMYGNKKHQTNNGAGNHYTHVKYVTGNTAQTVITLQIPAAQCFVGIEMFYIAHRIPASSAAAGRIGKKYFAITRTGSGSNVILDQGFNDDQWTSTTTSAGGNYGAGSGDTTIVRTGSEANTATQGVKITFLCGVPGNHGGYGTLKFDILTNISDHSAFSIT